MGGSAREAVLGKIRAALGPEVGQEAIGREWAGLERGYRQAAGVAREDVLLQFEDRLKDYDAGVYRAAAGEVAEVIARLLRERGMKRMAVAHGTPEEWRVPEVTFVEDAAGGLGEIDACDGVMTGATLGIAETGTIVLQHRPTGGQGQRALTLLPDYHLCVIFAEKVVQTVPEAMALLDGSARLATTFFSGPSATADIEMTRIKGVHGPRFVDVIVVL